MTPDPNEPDDAPAVQEDPPERARILIVDDDERNAYAAVNALEALGCDLVTAKSGEEALRKVLVDDFAVILLDVHMPGMDGYETAALIRSRKRTRGVPIVFLTAVFRDEAHLFQAYSAGAVDVVYKPVDPFILRSKVSVLVELHLKTREIQRQSEHRQKLLDENARVRSEKRTAERALARTRERQEAILKSLPIVFHSRSPTYPFPALFVSDGVEAVTGYAPHRFVDEPEFGLGNVHPEDVQAVVQALTGASQSGAYACEYRWRCADGAWRSLLDQGVLGVADDGNTREIFGAILDVTDQRMLEQQFAQAQKMEAVGQLTGGVAHDFNNLLTVVLGNVDLLERRAGPPERQIRQLAAVRHAAERGRALTRQLLAFSRRQHLTPADLDLNALIGRFAPLIEQAVGEAVTVRLDLSPDALCVNVDASQLEAALLNLAVNARDAMDGGGELVLSSRLATPEEAPAGEGPWVVMEVRDSGSGMSPDVVERIFEPFFTTKEVGHGSGLGLSQVYGFVRQSGGHIAVDSRPGEGSAFRLYLRASTAVPKAEPVARPQARKAPRGRAERLLVVEDDEAVLGLTVQMLDELGYQVTTAANAEAAVAILDRGDPIDLIFSDVVMPGGTSGVQLAQIAQVMRPDVKILLTSGYVSQVQSPAASEFPLIDKPYERSVLACRLRHLLEDKPSRREPALSATAGGA